MAVDSPPDFATSATLPPIPGLRFRHFAGPSDYPAMNDIANDCREANGIHFARALINATFEALRERGMTERALGVDTENVSGALRHYESCGFRPVSMTTTYRKPMPR